MAKNVYEIVYRTYGVAVYSIPMMGRVGGFKSIKEAKDYILNQDHNATFIGDIEE